MRPLSAVIILLLGLSARRGGLSFGVGDNGQRPDYVASSALGSAVAQASTEAGLTID
jgi:hypothetical protein